MLNIVFGIVCQQCVHTFHKNKPVHTQVHNVSISAQMFKTSANELSQ